MARKDEQIIAEKKSIDYLVILLIVRSTSQYLARMELNLREAANVMVY